MQVKGFRGAKFKKFKSELEAQAFIGGEPPAKKLKPNFSTIIEKLKTESPATDIESEDEKLFMQLPEYPDDDAAPATTSVNKKDGLKRISPELPKPTTEKSYKNLKFLEDAAGFVHVYTDGSCEGNGKFAAAAGLGVYFNDNHSLNVSEPVQGRPTNNAGEIQAAIRAIQDAQTCGIKRLNIFTDSQFLIKSVCLWMDGWKKKDWRLASGRLVVNQKDFKRLDELIEAGNMLVKWSYIPAHKGHRGNEEADRLAKIGASLYRIKKEKGEDDDDDE